MLWVFEDFCLFLVSCRVYLIFGHFSGIPVSSLYSEFTLFFFEILRQDITSWL